MWLSHIIPINYAKVFIVHLLYFWQTGVHHSFCFMAIAQSKQTTTQHLEKSEWQKKESKTLKFGPDYLPNNC